MVRAGEYQWVWQGERERYQAEGWEVVGVRARTAAALHGPDFIEVLLFRGVGEEVESYA